VEYKYIRRNKDVFSVCISVLPIERHATLKGLLLMLFKRKINAGKLIPALINFDAALNPFI